MAFEASTPIHTGFRGVSSWPPSPRCCLNGRFRQSRSGCVPGHSRLSLTLAKMAAQRVRHGQPWQLLVDGISMSALSGKQVQANAARPASTLGRRWRCSRSFLQVPGCTAPSMHGHARARVLTLPARLLDATGIVSRAGFAGSWIGA